MPEVAGIVVAARPAVRVVRRLVQVTGELSVVLGLVVLLFVAYEEFGVAARVAGQQQILDRQLDQLWQSAAAPPEASTVVSPAATADAGPGGRPLARLYLPRLALHWAVVQGVSPADLRTGPGHYPGSQLPGEPGNFAVAGHRVRGTFWDLDKLVPGDAVVVETAEQWFVYRVTGTSVVAPTDSTVIAANPADPGAPPVRQLLTLTTCNPRWGNWERLIVHAELAGTRGKTAGRPPELEG
ncbi:class E sortase [Amycolatopsis granulosa]|uniref:class E sortase n=1 Tax=Amycolatopsis granulosa TaxID=185684 RepID=UPI001422F30A|nr:class E sortase [Amycolatopsis granulosa]NIH84023.1 sortase A [Amycolatopsis granulosa]